MPTLAAQGIVAVTYTSTTVLMKVSLPSTPEGQCAASAHFGLLFFLLAAGLGSGREQAHCRVSACR